MNVPPPASQPIPRFFEKHALTFKLAWVFFLFLVLLIPLQMIRGILHERKTRRDNAVAEITASWGGPQTIAGPMLVVPYEYSVKSWKELTVNGRVERMEIDETRTARAFFLPAEWSLDGAVEPQKRHRGIYEAVVYDGRLAIAGRFDPPDFEALGIPADRVQWQNAEVTLGVSDLRGTGRTLSIDVAGQPREFAPGCRLEGGSSGLTARVPGLAGNGGPVDFKLSIDLKGSRGIRFAPVGKQNRVSLSSPWPDPSFQGAFLPADRSVGTEGFTASWEVSWYGRNLPQAGTDQAKGQAISAAGIQPSLFGVDFLAPVDAYRMVERGMKYGALFIALIFSTFYLFEVLARLRVHTLQYTLVGAALCLFYLALLSLSEFLLFAWAYWIGAAASTLLIVFYALGVLGTGRRAFGMGAALLAIYAFLFGVLQLQDYSLLLGTAGLFVVLGIAMAATRNLDRPATPD